MNLPGVRVVNDGPYARQVMATRLLTADEERAALERLGELRIARWRALVEHAPLVVALWCAEHAEEPIAGLLGGRLRSSRLSRIARLDTEDRVAELLERRAACSTVHASGAAYRRERDRFVRANLRLPLKLVGMMTRRWIDRPGLTREDLLQEANMGLVSAVVRFDVDRGLRFTTYAWHWIRMRITRSMLRDGRLIHVPSGKQRLVREAMKIGDVTDTSVRDLALAVGASPRELGVGAAALRAEIVPTCEEWEAGAAQLVCPRSIAAPDNGPDNERVRAVLATMEERERIIIEQRFGFADDEPRTLKEIGDDLGVSRERVRQLQGIALAKLRRQLEVTL